MRDARDLPDNISLQVLRALTERFSFDPDCPVAVKTELQFHQVDTGSISYLNCATLNWRFRDFFSYQIYLHFSNIVLNRNAND